MTPVELINSFVADKLDGDIQRLADFPLGSLRSDKVYGCPNRNFDSDDTELMRAIYCVVYGDTWENISMDNLGNGKLRGDTLNTYNTLFSPPWNDKFTGIWHPDEDLARKIKSFNTTFHRGCHDEWHDYEDRFLSALYKVLTRQPERDLDLEELVQLNHEDFEPFYGEEGWRKFIEGNMLEYYVNDNYYPVISSKGYTFWRGGYTNRERFITECHRYIDFSTKIIRDRARRMIEKIVTK